MRRTSNHDYEGSVQAEIEYSEPSRCAFDTGRWRLPAPWYTRRAGAVELFVLDTNDVYDAARELAQRTAIVHAIDAFAAPWRIAVGHQPLESAGLYGPAQGEQRAFLTRTLCNDDGTPRVHVYLAGHDHNLQHLAARDCAVDLVVSGGGGAPLYNVHPDALTLFARSTHGFVWFDATPSLLHVEFVDAYDASVAHAFDRARPLP